ncbi:PEGA domain-containing protein [Thermococcus sp. 2319x1]|uniref:protein kinase domain-containing protein n=1 Tax=Thermococcus sp. 2319x1 TaxID=1674923 RepID=UPI001E490445|nr:PEGA domain-containing protein [Thermococcus sp. 2319x1]
MVRLWKSKEEKEIERKVRMRKTLALLWAGVLVLSLLSLPVKAESQTYWAKTYGGSNFDWARAVALAENGDIIVAGGTESFGAGGYDVWVLRLDENGNVKWAKTYGGSGDDRAFAVAVAPNGDIIVAGETKSFGAGGYDVWVLRLDENGNVRWQKTYGGSGDDGAYAVAVAPNGDIIVAGYTYSFGPGWEDFWVLRLDENGNVRWQKTYGGTYMDKAYAVAIAPNGDIIVAGYTASFGAGGYNVWVLRLDADGNVKWQKTYGGNDYDWAYAVALAENGDIIVAGYTYSFGAGYDDVWVVRLDENGNVRWQKTYGGSYYDEAFAVALAENGDIIVAGYTASFGAGGYDVWVLRLDENGNVKWQKTYGGSNDDRAFAVALAENGDIIVAGHTGGFDAGIWDFWVLRLPEDGSLPDCSFCGDSTARIENTGAQVGLTGARVEASPAKIHNTNAEVQNANLQVETQLTYIPEGTLKIFSDPSGAEVYVNDSYKGTTSITLELPPGTYVVRLTKEGYQEYTATVTISAGETKTVSATLKPAYGYLRVESSPSGAEVYVDGSYVGTAPITDYRLSPGEHTIKVRKEGYQEYTITVNVEAGKSVSVSASLVPVTTSSKIPATSQKPVVSESTARAATSAAAGSSKLPYALGALILLVVMVAAKARGGKPRPQEGGEKPRPSPKKEEQQVVEVEGVEKTKPASGEKPVPASGRSSVQAPAFTPVPGFPSALLSRYEPLEFLGEGGFARVFKVKRKSDGKIVAVKIPRIDERTSRTFIKEVSSWLHLNHPNIVKLHDVDILPVPYLEMEYVEGVNVDGKTIRDLDAYPKPVDEKMALKLIKGVAEGLKHAHSKGIYHRDLKPLNILLKSDLTPKITDWGLAKVGTMSSTRSVLGYTPLYAAPEHLLPGKYGHTDARTDIWQLGVIFYELLTGKLPFEGYTYEEVFGKIVDESFRHRKPSEINPELGKYDGIFERLLAKRKEERYQSVDEFLRDLEKLEGVEKRRKELEKEVEELKKSLAKSMEALKQSKTADEVLKNRRMVVEALGKLALAYAELNKKADLLNTLNDLKFYTVQNLPELMKAIELVELIIKENLPVSEEFRERLKVLVHSIRREYDMSEDEKDLFGIQGKSTSPTEEECHNYPYGTIPVEKARRQPGSKIRAIHVCLDGRWHRIEIPGGHWSQTLRTLAEFLIDKGIQDIQVDGFIERSPERLVRDQNGDWVKSWYVYPPYPHEAINKLRELQTKLRQRYPNRKIRFALEISQPKNYKGSNLSNTTNNYGF